MESRGTRASLGQNGSAIRRIPLAQPDITDREIEAVVQVLKSSTLSIGPQLEAFEAAIAQRAQRRFGIGVNSGTSGLHLLVRGLGIGEGDEVITTPFSFVASSNCILFERARPAFVDIEEETLNIDPNLLADAVTPRTRAILPVHIFGHPADMDSVNEVARLHDLSVIEDACEALGATYRGWPAGSLGDGAVFAFYPNKQITTGEGGVVVTDDEQLARLCRSMRNQGRGETNAWLLHERLGYNYRLDELSAALGVVQMSRLDEILAARDRVARLYAERLAQYDFVRVPSVKPGIGMSWFVYVVRLAHGIDRDVVMAYLNDHGVGSRAYFSPIHLQPFYRDLFGFKPGDFPVTERVASQTLALPFFNHMTESDVDYVAETLAAAVAATRQGPGGSSR